MEIISGIFEYLWFYVHAPKLLCPTKLWYNLATTWFLAHLDLADDFSNMGFFQQQSTFNFRILY